MFNEFKTIVKTPKSPLF